MATKRLAPEDSYESVMTCPVCKDNFKDPRLLSCGHHFCLKCLEKISELNTKGSIPCPTCRFVTEEKPLALRKLKLNEFQAKANLYMRMKRARIEKHCGFCEEQTPASITCKECQLHLCDVCKVNHEPLEKSSGHQVSPISEFKFCSEHEENHAHCYCEVCDRFMCPRCLVKHGNIHNIVGIKELAEKAKRRLKNIALRKDTLKNDKRLTDCITDTLSDLKKKRDSMVNCTLQIEKHTKALLKKVELVKNENLSLFQKEIKELEILDHDAKEFVKTKTQLINHVTEVIETSSDCEIINREKDFPKYASDSVLSVSNKLSVEIPSTEELKRVANILQPLADSLLLTSDVEPIFTQNAPLAEMHVCVNVKAGGDVMGLAYNPRNDTYIIRTDNPKSLIQVLSPDGQIIETFASDITGMCDKPGDIAVDTKRNLYILPTARGQIVTFDMKGVKQNIFDVCQFMLTGISYCKVSDRYAVSSARYQEDDDEKADNSVRVVVPEDGRVAKKSRKGINATDPYFLTCYSVPGTAGAKLPRIAVSDFNYRGSSQIRILNSLGHLESVIAERRGQEFNGICTDFCGEIIVAELRKNEIIAYNTEQNKYRVLFKLKNEDDATLDAVAYNWKRRQIICSLIHARSNVVSILKEKVVRV